MAISFGVVAYKMLYGHRHIVPLNPPHNVCRDKCRQLGIFGDAFKGATTNWGTLQIYCRTKHDMSSFTNCFFSKNVTKFEREIGIP